MKTVTGLNPSKVLKESFMETLGNQNLNQNNLVQFTNDSFEQFFFMDSSKDKEKTNPLSIYHVLKVWICTKVRKESLMWKPES